MFITDGERIGSYTYLADGKSVEISWYRWFLGEVIEQNSVISITELKRTFNELGANGVDISLELKDILHLAARGLRHE